MATPELSAELITAIKEAPLPGAPNGESHQALADRLGVSKATVRKYRDEARQERLAATRETVEEHAREHTTDALADLALLRKLAREQYCRDKHFRNGQLWALAIQMDLKLSAGVDKPKEFDGYTDDDLRDLIRREMEGLPSGEGDAGASPPP